MEMEEGEPTHTRSGRLVKRKYLHEDLVTPEFALRIHESGGSIPSNSWQQQSHRGKPAVSSHGVEPNDAHDDEELDDFDEDAESDTNPDALYCFCRQPYNKRFMIACDRCNEWYHGACVGVTKQQGRQMEKLHQKWLCENCGGKKATRVFKASYAGDSGLPNPKADADSADTGPLPVGDHTTEFRRADSARSAASSTATSSSHSSTAAARDRHHSNSSTRTATTYNHNANAENPAPSPKRKSRIHRRCIKCNKMNPPQSIYCGPSCILQHAMDALDLLERYIKRRHAIAVENGTDAANIPNFTHVHVVEPHSGIELNGTDGDGAPRMSELKGWLMNHPTFTIRLPRDILEVTNAHHKATASSAPAAERQNSTKSAAASSSPSAHSNADKKSSISRKQSDSGSMKAHKHHSHHHHSGRKASAKDDDEGGADDDSKVDPVRQNVRQSLSEALTARWSEVKDAKENADVAVSSESITYIARRIERRLFKTFGDAGQKYKGKYRTILLNIKDKRNETFFRAILSGDVSPRQIVLLNSEDMASSELKKWREEEAKNYLELQKKGAEEIAQMKMLKKTHKGDLELVAVNDERAVRDDKLPDYVPPEEADEEDIDDVAQNSDRASSADNAIDADNIMPNTIDDAEAENITSRRVHMGNDVNNNINNADADSKTHNESVEISSESGFGGTPSETDKDTARAAVDGSSPKKRKSAHHDTTAEHGKHAFDSNCKICTGVISETGNGQPTSRAAFVRLGGDTTTSHSPNDADDLENDDNDDEDIDSQLIVAGDDAVFSSPQSSPVVKPRLAQTAATGTERSDPVRGSGSTLSVADDEAYDPETAGRRQPSKHARSGSSETEARMFDKQKPAHVKHSSPLSAVSKSAPPSSAVVSSGSDLVWSGSIHYHEVGSVDLCGQHLYGHVEFMRQCLRPLSTFQVIGRIGSSDVYRHFHQIKRLKEHGFVLLTLPAGAPAAAAAAYQAFVKWFCAKDRLAVIENSHLTKDIYMIPVDAKGGAGSTPIGVLSSLIGSTGVQRIDAVTKSTTGGALVLLVISRCPFGQAASALSSSAAKSVDVHTHHKHHRPPPVKAEPVSTTASLTSSVTTNPGGESEFEYEKHALFAAGSAAAKNDANYDATAELEADDNTAEQKSLLLPDLDALSVKIAQRTAAAALPTTNTVLPAAPAKSHDDDEEYSPGKSDTEDEQDVEMTDVTKKNVDDDEYSSLPELVLPKLPPPPPQPPTFVVVQSSSGEVPRDPRARAAAHLQQQQEQQQQQQKQAETSATQQQQQALLLFSNPSLAGVDIDAVIGKLLGCQTPAEMTEIFKALPSAEARRLLVDEMNRRVAGNQQQQNVDEPRPPRVIPQAMRANSANNNNGLLSTPTGDSNGVSMSDTKLPLLPDPNRLPTAPAIMPPLYAVAPPTTNTISVALTPVLPYGERRRPAFSGGESFSGLVDDKKAGLDRKSPPPRPRIGADGVALSRYGVPVTRVVDAKIKASHDKSAKSSGGGTDRRGSQRTDHSRRGDHRGGHKRNGSRERSVKTEDDSARGEADSTRKQHRNDFDDVKKSSHGRTSHDSGEKRTTSSEKREETAAAPVRNSHVKLEGGENGEKLRLPMGRIPRLPPREPTTTSKPI